jgi:peptidyl-prolyl cis-trans isomerase SurA
VLAPSAAWCAGAETVEQIVSVVDGQPILLTELEGRVLLEMDRTGIDPADSVTVSELRRQVLEDLIDQRVLQREAEAKSIHVTDEEVKAAVDDAVARNREVLGTEAAFQEQLGREGITEEELRQRYSDEARREIAASRLVQSEFRGQASVTPEEVRAYFEAHRAELPQREPTARLQRIAVRVQPDSVVLERSRALAADVRQQILSGQTTFAEAAQRWSADENGRDGGELGRVRRGDLAVRLGPEFEGQVFALDVGQVSEPLRSPFGYHLISVDEKDPAGAWTHIRHVLFEAPVVRADEVRAQERIREVLRRARAGEPFEQLARAYSEAPEASQGGDLGEVPLGALQDTVRAAIEPLAVGGLTEPVPVEGAFVVFRVLGREVGRSYAFAEIEGQLTDWLKQRQLESQYQEWIGAIKARYYIERHLEE